jgi:glyoxylase-like metal-dependent hydrolase (beta-lactamase superfamily II)
MGALRDLAERMWQGDFDSVRDHPVHARVDGPEEIADGVLTFKGIASANTFDTGDGLVMLDTGAKPEAAAIHAAVRRWRPEPRLAAAVFSHHHVDHVYGTIPFEAESVERGWARPIVYGHRDVARNFDRYKKTVGWNTAINRRQFALPLERWRFPEDFRYPDVTYERRLTFRQGNLTFELHHARGETEDATWVWVPEIRILHPGDLFIWAVPNAGNPQKVQRYAGEWAAGLREMAGLDAEVLTAGHGVPIFGAARIRQALSDTAELLESLEAQTLALMNAGAPLDRVIHEVEVPAHLRDQPYLRPIYDHPQFLVRNIWRLYGGWYDGEPDHLLPAPRAEQAREWITLAGGLDRSWLGPRRYESRGTCVWPATSSRWPWSPRPNPARPTRSGPRSMRRARRSSPRRWGAISSTTPRLRAGTAGAIWPGNGESGKRAACASSGVASAGKWV